MKDGIEFSQWFPWQNRKSVPGSNVGGVYLIARFPSGQIPNGPANPLEENVLNIGESGGPTRDGERSFRCLVERWDQWDKAARTGRKGYHRGGRRFFESGFPPPPHNLFVAALQFTMPSAEEVNAYAQESGLEGIDIPHALVAIRFGHWFLEVERDLLISYHNAHARLPHCNKEIPHLVLPVRRE
ncbi:MAG: hypothetical protein FJ320_01365 [SAR202 cluster bacterium]|nr:hypothetical protein [SAR202 cluster bacterium]